MNQDESLQTLERELGLPKGFCIKLIEEDDWSFVIKLHALMESAVSELITRALQRKELSDIFSHVAMSNTETGKIAFVKALDLLPAGHIQFIRELSWLRNDAVHAIQNVGLDLVEHFKREAAKLSPTKLRKLADLWGFGTCVSGEAYHHEPLARWIMTIKLKEPLPKGLVVSRLVYLLQKPKIVILWSALQILDAISICNWYGPQIWSFFMHMHRDDRKECEDWVHEVFGRAKVGDPELPEKIARRFERLNPGVRVRRDADGQPDLQSLAAAWRIEQKRSITELAEED